MAFSTVPANYKPTASQALTLHSSSGSNQVNTRASLPSVLTPHPLPSMSYPAATSHLIAILGQLQNQNLPLLPRPVTIVHYDVTGAPIISPHLLGIDEFILTSEYTLQRLVIHIQSVLDTKMGVMESQDVGIMRPKHKGVVSHAMQDTTDKRGKLLVSSIEVRGGGERFFKEFPGIMGCVVWDGKWKGNTNEKGLVNGRYDGREAKYVMWNHDDGQLQMYWEYYRMMVMKGVMLQVEKPILKVRTVKGIAAEPAGLVAGGHVFTRIRPPNKDKSSTQVKNIKKDEVASQIKTPLRSNTADLSALDDPEFQVAFLFQEELKSNGDIDLESIYNRFLEQGGQPIKELVFKAKDGENKEAAWVTPDDLDYQDDGSDVDTIRANEDSNPLLPPAVTPEIRAKFVEAEEAAAGFDEKDDDQFFPANSKPPTTRTAKKLQPTRRQKTVTNNFRSHIQGVIPNKREASRLNNYDMNMPKIWNRYPSPRVGHYSLADSSTPSKVSSSLASPNIQLESPAQALQPGSAVQVNRSSPLTRIVTTSQLRPESPSFNFPLASKISVSKPANWNFGLLGLFNNNVTANSTRVGLEANTGYQYSQANMNAMASASSSTGIGPYMNFQSSQNDQGMPFGISMTQTPPVGAGQSANFQNLYPEQNSGRTANVDPRGSPYMLYPTSQ